MAQLCSYRFNFWLAALRRLQYVEQQNGERVVAEALAYQLRLSLETVVRERQQLRSGRVNTLP